MNESSNPMMTKSTLSSSGRRGRASTTAELIATAPVVEKNNNQ